MTTTDQLALCSFCLKAHTDVETLVAGPGVYICDECVALSSQLVSGKRKSIKGKQIQRIAPWDAEAGLEAVLASWDQIGPREQLALAGFLCRAQAGLRFARCELNEKQALAAASLAAADVEAGLPHAVAAVLAATRLLAREAAALLNAEVAEGYLRFLAVGEETTGAGPVSE